MPLYFLQTKFLSCEGRQSNAIPVLTAMEQLK